MPELPEVETIVRALRPALLGFRITHVLLRRPDMLQPQDADLQGALAHRTICDIQRRGKKILVRFDDNSTLAVHLGMTGRLTLESPNEPLLPHTHLILRFTPIANRKSQIANPRELRFRDPRRFGYLHLLPPSESPDADLGPEPLSLRPHQLIQRLSRTTRPIKSALLDQSLLAGLGNIYVDESLFHAGIHPLTRANELTAKQVSRLNRSIKIILRRAIDSRGSSFRDYVDPSGQKGSAQLLHRVYARESKPCPTCRNPIQRIVITGRSTHFCPNCQPPTLA